MPFRCDWSRQLLWIGRLDERGVGDAEVARSTSGIPLAKGTEMRLIEAEARLRSGDVAGAIERINVVRAHHGLDPVNAGSTAEAWPLLMKERGLELWLEGRRLGDLRRWARRRGDRALRRL